MTLAGKQAMEITTNAFHQVYLEFRNGCAEAESRGLSALQDFLISDFADSRRFALTTLENAANYIFESR